MRQRTPVSDLQAREMGGSAASSPSRDLQVRHDESESDECNTSPPPEGRSAQTKRGAEGEAEGLAQNVLPSNSSPAMDAGAVGDSVRSRDDSVRHRDDRSTGREAARGRIEDEERKRREVGKREEEWNIPSESEHDKNGKQNNLSPAIDSRAFNWNSDQANIVKAPNEYIIKEEERLETGIHSLSSSDVDPRLRRAIDSISFSAINAEISRENTASQSGSCLQQNTESTGEGQGGGEKRNETGELGAIGGVETADKSIDNQDSLLKRWGRVVWGYIPDVLDSLSV